MNRVLAADIHFRYLLQFVAVAGFFLFTVLCFNLVVDPYNRNNLIELDLPKSGVAKKMHYALYKSIHFENNPQPVILLGDSRTNALELKYFNEQGFDNVANLGYGGGTLFEAIDTFWFAVEHAKLEKVILGIPFNLYSEANNKNRFTQAASIRASALSYYLSPFVARTGLVTLASKIAGRNLKSEKPNMTREQYWQHILGVITTVYLGGWKKPEALAERLKEIAQYCKENDIELIVFIPPTHFEFQQKIAEFHLESEYSEYKQFLSSIATVADFDFENPTTKNNENFSDPFHFLPQIAPEIVNILMSMESLSDRDDSYRQYDLPQFATH